VQNWTLDKSFSRGVIPTSPQVRQDFATEKVKNHQKYLQKQYVAI
jgi:hypothetical protein